MATSWDQPIKFEDSPAESFISTPGDSYPSLFETQTMDPTEMMTPPDCGEDGAEDDNASTAPSPAADGKKATKKRKSWGQVLPEPKTNLPPR
jgi:transcriptional activator HAC1